MSAHTDNAEALFNILKQAAGGRQPEGMSGACSDLGQRQLA
jgi:hypothetical protein